MFLKNKCPDKKDGIVVLKETAPGMCGGTDATQDTTAPKEIRSEDMVFFSATSCLNREYGARRDGDRPRFVSAFAAPLSDGVFLFLQKGEGIGSRGENESGWAAVKETIFPSLVSLGRACDLAKDNGYHSTTHGLPQNFGGAVEIRYADGEKISFSDNQQPILSCEAGDMIIELFEKAMKGERLPVPGTETLTAIRFYEERENGGFTEATLTLLPDGTGENQKRSRYDDEKVFESVNPFDKETVDAIKKTMADTGILYWSTLPESGNFSVAQRTMTFCFGDGTGISVKDGTVVPHQIRNGFFDIQLEITTKN